MELAGSRGGGSLRGVGMRPLGSAALDATDGAGDWYDSILSGLEIVTQSGSSVVMKGFDGRFGFGTAPFCAAFTVDLAGWLLSSHHFLRSEDAGGRLGSIGS